MNFNNLDELREAAEYAERIQAAAKEIIPLIEALKNLEGKMIIPAPADRLIRTGEVAKILGVCQNTVGELVKSGLLTPLYVDSAQRKFWLSEVQALPQKNPPRPKPDNLGDKRGRRKKS